MQNQSSAHATFPPSSRDTSSDWFRSLSAFVVHVVASVVRLVLVEQQSREKRSYFLNGVVFFYLSTKTLATTEETKLYLNGLNP